MRALLLLLALPAAASAAAATPQTSFETAERGALVYRRCGEVEQRTVAYAYDGWTLRLAEPTAVRAPALPDGSRAASELDRTVFAGDDPEVLQTVWTGRELFYVASGEEGGGAFGRVDLATRTTTRLIAPLSAARGLTYDHGTGHLVLFGGSRIVQVDPAFPSEVLAELSLAGAEGFTDARRGLVDGTADGRGYLFAIAENGWLAFVDYRASGRVDQATLYETRFLEPCLESVVERLSVANPCDPAARTQPYGDGWPGTLGVPTLVAGLTPFQGGPYGVIVGNSRGAQTKGCLIVSRRPISAPTAWGGTLLADPDHGGIATIALPIPVGGAVHTFSAPPVTPETCRQTVFMQAVMLDEGASHNVSFTHGLEVRIAAQP